MPRVSGPGGEIRSASTFMFGVSLVVELLGSNGSGVVVVSAVDRVDSSSRCRSRPSCVSVETMAMCVWEARLFLSKKEPPKTKPPISTGMSTVETMNALVVTRSRYSRRAMSQMLCMDGPSVIDVACDGDALPRAGIEVGVVESDGVDEDLFEGRLFQLEPRDTGSAGGG